MAMITASIDAVVAQNAKRKAGIVGKNSHASGMFFLVLGFCNCLTMWWRPSLVKRERVSETIESDIDIMGYFRE